MFKKLSQVLRENIFCKQKNIFISESADWVIKDIGKSITKNLNELGLTTASLNSAHYLLRNKTIHFGSLNTLINKNGFKKTHPSNKTILSFFHIPDNDVRIKYIPELNKRVDKIHTACELTKRQLLKYGLGKKKIAVIPLGIDLSVFKKPGINEKIAARKKLNLPAEKTVIGSFQKDGNGWGEGNTPKKIKGPDIFCDAVEKIAKHRDIHVLLTGPARGYVKKRLEKAGIGYTHHFLENYHDIVTYYHALDLYLITSRVEGGPMAILETMACATPCVSTPVGMAPEIIQSGINGIVTEKIDPEEIAEKALRLLEDKRLQTSIGIAAQKDIQKFDWKNIIHRYHQELYKPLNSDIIF